MNTRSSYRYASVCSNIDMSMEVEHEHYPKKDIAGQERYQTITSAYYRGAHGIILVYSINDQKSFQSILKYVENIKKNTSGDIEIVLVGNNCEPSKAREVCREEAEELSRKLNISYFEVNSKMNMNIDEPFECLVGKIMDHSKNRKCQGQETVSNENKGQGTETSIDEEKSQKSSRCNLQ